MTNTSEHLRVVGVLVNVGRGTVVDEVALLPALRDGRIGYAALDVCATEPLPAKSPLWDEPNVLVSPHTAALNSAEDRLIAELFAANPHSVPRWHRDPQQGGHR